MGALGTANPNGRMAPLASVRPPFSTEHRLLRGGFVRSNKDGKQFKGSDMSYRPEFFSWRKAILKSNLPPTTRHVLLTLACHMNDAGESCYPSIKLLCSETGLSNRTVITHLQDAKELGWITVGLHGFAGQKWAAHEYFPGWPHNLRSEADSLEKAMNEVHQLKKKAVKQVHKLEQKGSEPNAKGGELGAKGGEPNDKKAVKEVHTSTSRSTSKSTPESTSLSLPEESGKKNPPSIDENPSPEDTLQFICKATWKSYSDAYFNRYGIEPIRNAQVNTAIKSFCKKIPYQEAPHVAAFFVSHNDKYYLHKTHHPSLMSKDAEGLRTQWATGRTMTGSKATDLERTSSNADAAQEAIAMIRRRNGHATA